jgi:hypothetical protein
LIYALSLLLERAKYLVESPRILHAPFLMEDRVAELYSLVSSKKTVRVGDLVFGAGLRRQALVPRWGPDVRPEESSNLVVWRGRAFVSTGVRVVSLETGIAPSRGRRIEMARCEVCGNEYDKAFSTPGTHAPPTLTVSLASVAR